MITPNEESGFKQFLSKEIIPKKPTPKEIEWARKRFSSRAEPPKS